MKTLTYLQPGMTVLFDGEPHRVTMVNDCRARIEPMAKRTQEIRPATGANAGRRITFSARQAGHNISPDSPLPILSWE
ncbi:MAG: hypothetical protein KIS67_20200 [Verrucomicrobiae bacterium]|nr:hypothetical protein [Verrucomicrobiae bacterium]